MPLATTSTSSKSTAQFIHRNETRFVSKLQEQKQLYEVQHDLWDMHVTLTWLAACERVFGFTSSCIPAQDDASKLLFMFETQLTVQTNTSQEEAKEGEWDKETSSLN